MARRAARRPPNGTAHYFDHHVWARRDPWFVGETSARATRLAGRNRRLHRVRAASLRPYGSADVPPRHGTSRPDVPRSRAHAFRRAAGPASTDPQYPDVLGEEG